jgi:hypothetical protein
MHNTVVVVFSQTGTIEEIIGPMTSSHARVLCAGYQTHKMEAKAFPLSKP